MISFKIIFFIIGILLSCFSVFMVIPLITDLWIYPTTSWKVFANSIFITGFTGLLLFLGNRYKGDVAVKVREAFLMTTLCWIVMILFSSLPFYFSNLNLSFTDCCFETVASLTTTGSTVLNHLGKVSKGLLLWRSMLQWLGGIGIIVMALTIFPALRIGGMQLFRSEFSDRSEKILPKVSQLAGIILTTYSFLTILCLFSLKFAGMNWFDATCHSLTTLSTGGLSTHDDSISSFRSVSIEIVLMIFMFIGGTTLLFFIKVLKSGLKAFKNESQIQVYISLVIATSLLLSIWIWFKNDYHFTIFQALRYSTFITISTITSTGYVIIDYAEWNPFLSTIIFMISLVGGCTGSTTGGIKIFRIQILFQLAQSHLKQLRRPHGVFLPIYQGQVIPESVAMSVFTFLILYCFSLVVIASGLAMTGLDFVSAITGAAASLGNLGPGLGHMIGPTSTYAYIPDAAKWILMFAMILGRLELLTVIILLTPSFWKD